MVRIESSEIVNVIRNATKTNVLGNPHPLLLPSVQPILDISPRSNKILDIIKNATIGVGNLTVTIMTTDERRDFFIFGISIYPDTTGTSEIKVYINNEQVSLIQSTSTARFSALMFPIPIKVDRNSIITLTCSGVANGTGRGYIYGYYENTI